MLPAAGHAFIFYFFANIGYLFFPQNLSREKKNSTRHCGAPIVVLVVVVVVVVVVPNGLLGGLWTKYMFFKKGVLA